MGTLLLLKILRGRDLAACDSNGLSDPYIKLTYQKVKAKTQIIRKTLDPVWNEAFPFGVVPVGAQIHLECWDWDKLSSDDFMGQAIITITPEIAEVGTHRMWLQLEGRGNKKETISGAIEVEFVVRLIDEVLGNSVGDKPKRSARRSITHLVRLGSAGSVASVPPAALARSASGAISPKGDVAPQPGRAHPLFGVELSDLMAAQAATHPKLKVPLFLHKTLEWLNAHNMDETIGIFRVGGVQRRSALIRAEIENTPTAAFAYQDETSVHDVSGLVKAWLRELPTPLWTFPLYNVFFDSSEQTKVPSQEVVLAALSTIPEHNLAVTHVLMRMCRDLALNKEVNRMDAQNLAIVIAPNLLWKPQAEDTLTSLMEYRNSLAVITDITQALIENYDNIASFTTRDQAESDTVACNSGPVLIGRSRQRVYAPVAPKILSIAEMDSHTLFSSFDIDGSGALDPLEFAVFYKDLSAALGKRTPTNCEIMEVINAVDANGDGEITYAEFAAWWDQCPQQ